ncbi:adhesion regulation modulator protein [Theileria orientalis]|uniref:Adhesion regulation modulator protein n=1 Tax=Theileria orientalis TaxID=68886 RepID=A0A976QSB9_THEOR|nr:adhesion regulation modulator protein [Theileria orientalis]
MERGVLCEIRAGKCVLNEKLVSPDLRKGSLRLFRGDDELLSVQWLTRDDSKVEDTFYIFEDAFLERVPECSTGEVYALKFTSNSHKSFYWMQEPNTSTIKSFVDRFNKTTGFLQ